MEYFLCMILFSVGLYALITKTNILKIILGLGIMGYSINMFFIVSGYKINGEIPIIHKETAVNEIVDPLAQSIVLITVIIGLCVTFFLTALGKRLYEKYNTFDMAEIKKLKG